MPTLPAAPKVGLELARDQSHEREGFLALKRYEVVVSYEDGTRSKPVRYDFIERRAMDAAVMAVYFLADRGPEVYLRTSVRPPLAFRTNHTTDPVLWELPAGLIEPGEDPRHAAVREIEEELGFAVAAEALHPLGGFTLPAPGFIAEEQWFFHVQVDPRTRREPDGDGSPFEYGARIVPVPLDEALAACRAGHLVDAKTELGLRRLAEVL